MTSLEQRKPAPPSQLPMLEFILKSYHHFNAAALRNALVDYHDHVRRGGKMYWSLAGAMSTARLGIHLAPAIRSGLVHGLSVTGANLEESLFRLVAHNHFAKFTDYRYFRKEDDADLLARSQRRVTDTAIPEDEAFRKVEQLMVPMWQRAQERGERRLWHEYFYELITDPRLEAAFEGDPEECWLLAAAEADLPIVVGGHADSTFGNIFAGYCYTGDLDARIVKSDIEYMMDFYDVYRQRLAVGAGVGFFQIGGGIAGDFPICVVPSIKYDLEEPVEPWAYFCQISDSVTSYGSYSGATPNEKITWDKLTPDTPMHVIESDATIVAPMMLQALVEACCNPVVAAQLLASNG
ncbi:MAG: deoxyhypusine synthase family protein [Acidimicrobiales bacterium]